MNLTTVSFVREYFCVFSTVTIVTLIIVLLLKIFMGGGWLRKSLVFILCTVLLAAFTGTCVTGYDRFILKHDYRELFGWRIPNNSNQRMLLTPKILDNLRESKSSTEAQIAAYKQGAERLAKMPRGTAEEKAAYDSVQEDVSFSLESALDYKSVYDRRRAAAYYAGFEKEVARVGVIAFEANGADAKQPDHASIP